MPIPAGSAPPVHPGNLFITCFIDTMFPRTGRAVTELVVAAQHGDAALTEAVERVVPTVYELSELLVDVLGLTDVGAYFPHRGTYHPTCHSLRMLRVGDRPLKLLRAVKGIDLVELPAAESCWGFGGTFALKNADVSNAVRCSRHRAPR